MSEHLVEVSRRGVLASAAVGLTSILTGDQPLAFSNEVEAIGELREYTYDENASRVYPDLDKLVTSSNERLNDLGQHDTAFVVVHAGFLDTQAGDLINDYQGRRDSTDAKEGPNDQWWLTIDDDKDTLETFIGLQKGEQGDYNKYLENLLRLYRALGTTAAPVIFYAEGRDIYNPTIPESALTPPDNALIVVTEESDNTPVHHVRGQVNGRMEILPQREELLFDALHAAGVKTVIVAGEYGANPWDGWPACLGSVVLKLAKNDFAVKGVEGAVFPSAPPKPTDDVMVNALYRNPISLDTALTAAARG